MIFLVSILVSLAAVTNGLEFLDARPDNAVEGNSFQDCPARFKPYEDDGGYYVTAIGGERAYQGEFQHMAVIGWTRSDGAIEWLCGASLITWQFLLTAAHCATDLDNIPPDTVRLGDTDLESTDDDDQAVEVSIERFITHPKYRASRKYFDIALVKMMERVYASPAVCTACVWRETDTPMHEKLAAVGFGALGFGEKNSPTLQKVQLSVYPADECTQRVPTNRRSSPDGLRDDQFCAGSPTMDTCSGDSGGPIQIERPDVFGSLFPLIVGVVSYGTPCINGSTGVYTRVSSYIDWIEDETNQSLDYDVCTGVNLCVRTVDPSITASTHRAFPRDRFGLLWDYDDTSIDRCGATLIDYRFLVTSAECVTSRRGYPEYITATAEDERFPVQNVFVHPQYRPGEPGHDIALIELSKYANVDEALPACPWSLDRDGEWMKEPSFAASIAEAGHYVEYFDRSKRTITLSSLQGERCSIDGSNDRHGLHCIRRNVSLVPETCTVDYGGPVMAKVAPKVFRLYGVLSRLTQSCESNIVFTEITPYLGWMESIMFKHLHERLIFTS